MKGSLHLGIPFLVVLFLFVCLCKSSSAGTAGKLSGTVLDPLGAVVPNANVALLQNNNPIAKSTTDSQGSFEFSITSTDRYSVRVEATGFETQDSSSLFVASGSSAILKINLKIGVISQHVVVSATGSEIPDSQVGASITVIDRSAIADMEKPDVLGLLQTVPGLQVVQTGQRGGTTSVSILGGEMANDDFNKVVLDGIPINDIGGNVEFANLSTTGVDNVEILRGANSVLYGSDALGGVISMTTPRGTSTLPELTYSGDAGNLGTYQNDVSVGEVIRRFDYFSEFSRFDTQNDIPNNGFHNATYSGNFGWAINGTTDLRFTIRHTAVGLGDPNAIDLFGVPDLSSQNEHDTYFGLTVQNQTTKAWHNLIRYASTDLNFGFADPAPAGTLFDGNYIGNVVTVRGANGFSVTGRAILDFGGSFPQTFDSKTTRRSIYAQSDYQVAENLAVTAGFRYENENGFADSPFSERNNFSYFLEAHGDLFRRLYATAGVGLEDNAVFGFAATPRASLAYYLRRPTANGILGDTKLIFNYGKGIKEPSIFDAGSSLFSVLSALPQGASLISQFGIGPLGPEQSTNYDFGIEQTWWDRRARLNVEFFHNEFFNLIQFLGSSALPLLGFPQQVVSAVAASAPGGATVNSESYRALGAEAHIEIRPGHGFLLGGSYTYVDPVVTETFASTPVFNPAFPGIPIGAEAPLAGERPFRLAPHSGTLFINYSKRHVGITATGYFVSRSDDSTFLTDQFGGTSLLLPNRNLNAGYQKIDVSGTYGINSVVTLFASAENVLDEHYTAAFGFPSLPVTFRAGVKFVIGGNEWKHK